MRRRALNFTALTRDQRRYRERPEKTPEQMAAWVEKQVQDAMGRIAKQRGR